MRIFWMACMLLFANSAQARPAADPCFQELTCTGRVHRFDNQLPTASDQDLSVAYFAVDFGRVMPLPELQSRYQTRLKNFEAVCNLERYRRSTFGPDSWSQDSRFTYLKSDLKCFPTVENGGACRIAGQACQDHSDCCENLGARSCDTTRGVCKMSLRSISTPRWQQIKPRR